MGLGIGRGRGRGLNPEGGAVGENGGGGGGAVDDGGGGGGVEVDIDGGCGWMGVVVAVAGGVDKRRRLGAGGEFCAGADDDPAGCGREGEGGRFLSP